MAQLWDTTQHGRMNEPLDTLSPRLAMISLKSHITEVVSDKKVLTVLKNNPQGLGPICLMVHLLLHVSAP